MALPYFYEPLVQPQTVPFELSEDTSKHCVQVLRMQEGEQLLLTNGHGSLFTATITSAHKKSALVQIVHEQHQPAPVRKTSIAISLLKNNSRFEWFLEKATEMGINSIIPLISARTEHQRFRFDRMQQIVISAMLQSKQAWLPTLTEPQRINDYIDQEDAPIKLIAHCEEGDKQPLLHTHRASSTSIMIGPEGDFSPEEIKLAIQKGFLPVSLGQTRLRTETAGILAAAFLANI